MTQHKKILYLFDCNDWKSRMPVAEQAVADGYNVVIMLIGSEGEKRSELEGFRTIHVKTAGGPMKAGGLLSMVTQIRKIIRSENPDLVHTVTLKYAFITGLAVIPFKSLRKVYTLAGLGYLFRSPDAKASFIRGMLKPLLQFLFKAPHVTLIFQNPDDWNLMLEGRYTSAETSVLIRGSGVHLDKFTPTAEVQNDEAPLVLMPTRLVHEKGVSIFIEAARMLKNSDIDADFQIAGGETRHNPKASSRDDMLEMTKCGAVTWLGRVEDMPALLQKAAFVVYPSYYGEGIPRVMLEAAAAGKPIITADSPGCRETVNHGENGFLVPVKDVQATAKAMKMLIEDKDLRVRMGTASRAKAEVEFDIHLVVEQTLSVYKAALS